MQLPTPAETYDYISLIKASGNPTETRRIIDAALQKMIDAITETNNVEEIFNVITDEWVKGLNQHVNRIRELYIQGQIDQSTLEYLLEPLNLVIGNIQHIRTIGLRDAHNNSFVPEYGSPASAGGSLTNPVSLEDVKITTDYKVDLSGHNPDKILVSIPPLEPVSSILPQRQRRKPGAR